MRYKLKNKKIIFWTLLILFLIIVALFFYLYYERVIVGSLDVLSGNGTSNPPTDEEAIETVYLSYLEAGKNCDIDKAMSIITEQSKEIIHYTCSNMANETKCYRDRDYEIKVNGDNAVLYLIPFNHKIENPFFFSKENGEWRFNFYKMWAGLVMSGSTCDSGWGWRNQELADEFCSYFDQGQCPDK